MDTFESSVKLLTPSELTHLIVYVIGEQQIKDSVLASISHQRQLVKQAQAVDNRIPKAHICYDCEHIARKLWGEL